MDIDKMITCVTSWVCVLASATFFILGAWHIHQPIQANYNLTGTILGVLAIIFGFYSAA